MFPLIAALTDISTTSPQEQRLEEFKQLQQSASYTLLLDPKCRNQKNVLYTITLNPLLYPIIQHDARLFEIANLSQNWDGYGAITPTTFIIKKTEDFINDLPISFRQKLDVEYIFPNPNGTLTVEWRSGKNVVSIEFGESSANFYSIINGVKSHEEGIKNKIPDALLNSLEAFFA